MSRRDLFPTMSAAQVAKHLSGGRAATKVRNPADQTDTPAFKAWFGNSKVVDKDGRPKVVYHGSAKAGFDTFKREHRGVPHAGFFFADTLAIAKTYSEESEVDALTLGKQSFGVYRVYLSMQHPLVINARGAFWSELRAPMLAKALTPKQLVKVQPLLENFAARYGDTVADAHFVTDHFAAIAETLGYDGIIFNNIVDYGTAQFVPDPSTVYVVFDPRQIKSADHNKGTFDPQDPNIKNPLQTFIPPPAVAAEARKGIELRASQPASNKCCTPVGLRRAVQLANRQPVSEDTLRRMRAYFDRHYGPDSKGRGWGVNSKGWQAHLCWGGDAGRRWVESILGGRR